MYGTYLLNSVSDVGVGPTLVLLKQPHSLIKKNGDTDIGVQSS